MQSIGKALGTAAVWAGVAGLSYLFNSFNVFDSTGAVLLVICAAIATMTIWDKG